MEYVKQDHGWLQVHYQSQTTCFTATLSFRPVVVLVQHVAAFVFNLVVLALGSLGFIILLLQPAGLITVALALASLGAACCGEFQVLNALRGLQQLAGAPLAA
jgi:hypothetical protein